MAHATVPTASAPTSDTADNQTVTERHCRYSGIYSRMTLKLKTCSMTADLWTNLALFGLVPATRCQKLTVSGFRWIYSIGFMPPVIGIAPAFLRKIAGK
jgi:hypothetical protein